MKDREAHDVEKVPLQPLHQQSALALHAVGPGLVHGLAGGDIAAKLRLCGGTEDHGGGLAFRQAAVPLPDGDAGADGVAAALKRREHFKRVGLVPGLAETLVI